MARKFRIVNLRTPIRRLPNRCIFCGTVIPMDKSVCDSCRRRMRRTFS